MRRWCFPAESAPAIGYRVRMRLAATPMRWLMPLLLLAALACGRLDDARPSVSKTPADLVAASSSSDLVPSFGPAAIDPDTRPNRPGQVAPCDDLPASTAIAVDTGSHIAPGRCAPPPLPLPAVAPRRPGRASAGLRPLAHWSPPFGLIQAELAVLRR